MTTARDEALKHIVGLTGNPKGDPWHQALRLLYADPARLCAPDLDAFLAAATAAVDLAADGPADVATGVDLLLLATGLRLRGRRGDGGGPRTAARHLAAATERIPTTHPAARFLIEALGSFLDTARPLSGVVEDVAEPFGAYTVAAPTAVVAAIGALCRASVAVRAGSVPDADTLAAAAEVVPAGHVLRPVLLRAAGHARLAVAARSGDPAAADHLTTVPDGDDPSIAAIVGAMWLAAAEGRQDAESADLDRAIAALRTAVDALGDDPGSGLRSRTWRRLATAYRIRAAPGDAEEARAAGLTALRGADQDPRWAARYAGWMLADGRAEEAFTALEIAAAARGSGEAEPVEDVDAVLVGAAARGVPAPEPPSRAEVAAALRAVGAVALVYLHPTDEAGRTVGVLCLDAATERIDVAANVPVTDPLVADDPTWPAIVERWLDRGAGRPRRRMLLAATGGLTGIMIPAARSAAGRRLAEELDVSRVASGGEAVRLAARAAGAAPMFVAGPERVDPVSVVDAPEGPGDVLDAVGIEADGGAGGVVVLPPTGVDAFTLLADALLDAGCTGVVGWLRPVEPSIAALAEFMLRVALVDEGRAPAAAVGAVQRWMLDPDRAVPPDLPDRLAGTARADLTAPELWAPLTYRGR